MAKAATSIPPAMRSQKELVEEILNDGIESPSEIVDEVKTRFGVEVAKGNVNQIKVKWKKNKGAKPAVSTRKKRGPNKPKVGMQGGTSTVDNGFVSDGQEVGKGLVSLKGDTVGNPPTPAHLAVEGTLVLCKVFGADRAREIIAAFK